MTARDTERRRLLRAMAVSERAIPVLDEKIGQLMNQRVSREEHIAECLTAIRRLEEGS